MCTNTIRMWRCICPYGFRMQSEPDLDTALAAAVVTGHSPYERAAIRPRGKLIVDTRHARED